MLSILKKVKEPKLLVVTPLLTGHKISKETKVALLRNDLEFDWISYESDGNTAKNYSDGINAYRKKYPAPKYVMMVDRDILPSRHMLDKMLAKIERSKNDIAFVYCNFEFRGTVNRRFYNIPYDPLTIVQNNYVSSNSMIKLNKLDEIGGVITDDKYKRLLDWALWLTFLSYGYYGELCADASFVAISDDKSISAGTPAEYNQKRRLIQQDFIEPMLSGVIF